MARLGQATSIPLVGPLLARFQAQVGELLQDRQVLMQLQPMIQPQDQETFATLVQAQTDLENQVGQVQGWKDSLLGGDLTVLPDLVAFVAALSDHLSAVRFLRARYGGGAVGIDWKKIGFGLAIAVGLWLVVRSAREQ